MGNCKDCNKEKMNKNNLRCYFCAQKERFTRMKVWNKGLTKENDSRMIYDRPTLWKKKDKRISGMNQHSWKGGITPINTKLRNSFEYEQWRKKVFERDLYTCQDCEAIGEYLHADHIKSFSDFPNLRFDISNGRTLCTDCHYFRTFGKKIDKDNKWGHRLGGYK